MSMRAKLKAIALICALSMCSATYAVGTAAKVREAQPQSAPAASDWAAWKAFKSSHSMHYGQRGVFVDMTDPVAEKAFYALLRMSGKNEKTDPKLYADARRMKQRQIALKKQGKSPVPTGKNDAGQTVPMDFFGRAAMELDDKGQVTATALVSQYRPDPKAAYTANVTLAAWDATRKTIAHGSEVVNSTDNPVAADTRNMLMTAPPVIYDNDPLTAAQLKDVQVVGIAMLTYGSNEQVSLFLGTEDDNSVEGNLNAGVQQAVDKATLAQPVGAEPGATVILCTNRGNPSTPENTKDCNYGPTQPGKHNNDTTMLIPVEGKVITNGPLVMDTTHPDRPAGWNSFQVQMRMPWDVGGVCSPDAYTSGQLFDSRKSAFNVSNDKKTFTFTFDDTTSPTPETQFSGWLDFGPVCGTSGQMDSLLIYMSFQATIQQNMSPFVVQYSYTDPLSTTDKQEPFFTWVKVPEINVQFGCIVEGTEVTMADGRKVAIEKLHKGDMILSKDGKSVRVAGTMPGTDRDFVEISVLGASPVVVTPTHPIRTQRGVLAADKLKVGDSVYTGDKVVLVKRVKRVKTKTAQNVYNLILENADGSAIANPDDAIFLAGGIQVGDNNTQGWVIKRDRSK